MLRIVDVYKFLKFVRDTFEFIENVLVFEYSCIVVSTIAFGLRSGCSEHFVTYLHLLRFAGTLVRSNV